MSRRLGKAYSFRDSKSRYCAIGVVREHTFRAVHYCRLLQFETRLPLITDEDTREFINVECTYNVQYTIRR